MAISKSISSSGTSSATKSTTSSTPTKTSVSSTTVKNTTSSTPTKIVDSAYKTAVAKIGVAGIVKAAEKKYGVGSKEAQAIKNYGLTSSASSSTSTNTTKGKSSSTPTSANNQSSTTNSSNTKTITSTKPQNVAVTLQKYNEAKKIAGSSENIVKSVESKFGVGSSEAEQAKNMVRKFEGNKVSTPIVESTKAVTSNIDPIKAKKIEDYKNKKEDEKKVSMLNDVRKTGQSDDSILMKAESKYGKDSTEYSKISDFIKKNPQKTGTEEVNSSLLDKTKDELEKKQIDVMGTQKDDKISTIAENYLNSKDILENSNKSLQNFYTGMQKDLKDFIVTATNTKNAALERTKTTELNRVVGQVRATLAKRGINISEIPPEQLIAMSGELGAKALEAINEAISATENEILKITETKTAEINSYLEKGLIKQNEADIAIENLRQLKEKMISEVNDNFISNAFSIANTSIENKKITKSEVINAVSKFADSLGISGTALGIVNNYLNSSDAVSALQSMIADLSDTESNLYKAVADIEKARQLQAEFENKLKAMNATKSSSSGSSTSSVGNTKLGEATTLKLLSLNVPGAESMTRSGLANYLNSVTQEERKNITDTISKTLSAEEIAAMLTSQIGGQSKDR